MILLMISILIMFIFILFLEITMEEFPFVIQEKLRIFLGFCYLTAIILTIEEVILCYGTRIR